MRDLPCRLRSWRSGDRSTQDAAVGVYYAAYTRYGSVDEQLQPAHLSVSTLFQR